MYLKKEEDCEKELKLVYGTETSPVFLLLRMKTGRLEGDKDRGSKGDTFITNSEMRRCCLLDYSAV